MSPAVPTSGAAATARAAATVPPEAPGAVTFDSLGMWHAFSHVLGVGGPRKLLVSRHYRSAAHGALARVGWLG